MIAPETYRLQLSFGLYARVAKKLALGKDGRSHVRRVAVGERKSARVLRALEAEAQRIERQVAAYQKSYAERAA